MTGEDKRSVCVFLHKANYINITNNRLYNLLRVVFTYIKTEK